MRWLALFLVAPLVLCGCGLELLTTTAIQSDLQAQQLTAIKGQVQQAAGTTGRINIEKAIQTYQAEKGQFPPSLDALVPDYLPAVPKQPDGSAYGYDPVTGALSSGPTPSMGAAAGIPAEDRQTMETIRAAIDRYGQAAGYYPPTLDALYPVYMAKLPRTTAGQPFLYNNQNGYVGHPSESRALTPGMAQSPPQAGTPRRGAGVAGAGPMGEAMTGIAIQNELGQMNQSGVSAAGSRMRQSAGNLGQGQDARNNQAMDDLGL